MIDEWSPFHKAEFHLPRYNNFFPREIVEEAFGNHPQILEDWLTENCPNNYCYVWVYSTNWSGNPKIIGDLIGMPKDVALALKLITSVNILHRDSFVITNRYSSYFSKGNGQVSYRVESHDSKIF